MSEKEDICLCEGKLEIPFVVPETSRTPVERESSLRGGAKGEGEGKNYRGFEW